jgi:hypothetical protein
MMKKIISLSVLGIFLFMLGAADVHAGKHKNRPPDNFLSFSFFWLPSGIGLQHRVYNNIYATGNLDYIKSDKDLTFQAGAVYLIPKKILIFQFYGGTGFQFSRNHGYDYPYIRVGTNILFLFTEVIHPLRSHEEPNYRCGFNIKF